MHGAYNFSLLKVYKCHTQIHHGSQESVVGIAKRLRYPGWRGSGSNPGRGNAFSPSPKRSDRYRSSPSSLFNGHRVSPPPRGVKRRGRDVDHLLPCSLRMTLERCTGIHHVQRNNLTCWELRSFHLLRDRSLKLRSFTFLFYQFIVLNPSVVFVDPKDVIDRSAITTEATLMHIEHIE